MRRRYSLGEDVPVKHTLVEVCRLRFFYEMNELLWKLALAGQRVSDTGIRIGRSRRVSGQV